MATLEEVKGILTLDDKWTGGITNIIKSTLGIGGALASINKALSAQSAQEESILKLNRALANQGKYTEENSKKLIEFSEQLEANSTFADDNVLSMEALLTTFGLTTDQVQKATQAAADFSAGTGRDLGSAVQLLGRAASGSARGLSRFGIVIDETKSKSERFDSILEQLNQKFGGSAKDATLTYRGSLEQLHNAIDNTWESLGKLLGVAFQFSSDEGPFSALIGLAQKAQRVFGHDFVQALGVLRAVFAETLASMLLNFAGLLDKLPQGLGGFGGGLKSVSQDIKLFAFGLQAAASDLEKEGYAAAEANGRTDKFRGTINDTTSKIVEVDEATKKWIKSLQEMQDQLSGKTSKESIDLVTTAYENLTKKTTPSVEVLGRALDELNSKGPEGERTAQALAKQWLAFSGVLDLVPKKIEIGFEGIGDAAEKTQGQIQRQAEIFVEGAQKSADEQKKLNELTAKFAGEQFLLGNISQETYIKILKGLDLLSDKVPEVAKTMMDEIGGALENLPKVILGAIQGGGDVLKSIGASFGGDIGKAIAPGIAKAIGGTLGSTIGSVIPGLGTLAGGLIGSGIGNLVGGLFHNEEEDVNDLRDAFLEAQGGFVELQKKLSAVTDEDLVKKIFDATTVDEFNAAVSETMSLLDLQGQAQQKLQEAIDRYGFSIEELGPKFKQQKLDEMAGQLLQDFKLLTASGIDTNTVIEKMGPSLLDFINTSRQAGVAIPEQFRAIVDALIKSGKLVDENGNAFKSAEEAGISFTESLTDGLNRVIDAIEKLVSALTGIPSVPDVPGGGIGGGGVRGDEGRGRGYPFESADSGMHRSLAEDTLILAHRGERVDIGPGRGGDGMSGATTINVRVGDTLVNVTQPMDPAGVVKAAASGINDNIAGGLLDALRRRGIG
jgi:uncharacterized coiled-coil protein SlyX